MQRTVFRRLGRRWLLGWPFKVDNLHSGPASSSPCYRNITHSTQVQSDSVSSQALVHPSPLASLLLVSPKLWQLITQTHSTLVPCNLERQMIQNLWNQKLMNKCLPFISYTDNMEYTSQGFPKVPWNKTITSHSSQLKSTFYFLFLFLFYLDMESY